MLRASSAVEPGDLRPVDGLGQVQRGDRRLQDVRPLSAQRDGAVERAAARDDLRVIPERAILILQQHELVALQACRATRVVQQRQRQQAVRLGLVGHQRRQRQREPDRLVGQVVAAAVALVVDEVEDREHRRQALGQQLGRRHAERDARDRDLPLRAHQPLRHRRLLDEERLGDLGRREAAERAQRQGHLRVERERRVAAGEDQLEPLVGKGAVIHGVLGGEREVEQPGLGGEHALAPDAVERAVAPDRDQPGRGARRHAVARPALGSAREGLLRGVLGEVEVAEEADQGGEDATPVLAEAVLDQYSTSARTSMAPPMRAAGMRAASASAASRSATSNR